MSPALLTADLVGDAADGSAVYTTTSNSAVPVAAIGRQGLQSASGVTDKYIFAVSMRNGIALPQLYLERGGSSRSTGTTVQGLQADCVTAGCFAGTTQATFSLSGALSGATHVDVIGEARQIMIFNDRFSDTFTDFEVGVRRRRFASFCSSNDGVNPTNTWQAV